jgi:WhiB family redox-sensing transcriptional regulator
MERVPINSRNWRHYAECLDHNPELFFPVGTTGPAVEQTKKAKAVCAECPVIDWCREWAINTAQEFGIWAGMDEGEPRRLLARRALNH